MLPRILIIDDDPAIRQMLHSALSFAGYPVAAFPAAEQALLAIDTIAPELILCDVLMAGMDGLEFCAALGATADHRHVPVILMSGIDDLRYAAAHPGVAFLAKPFELDMLYVTVEHVLIAHGLPAALT